MTSSWTLTVARDDLADARLVDTEAPEPADGEALLRVDRVGVTANNVTYGVLGESFRYWDFFPPPPAVGPGRGVVPLWGFAEVAASRTPGVEVGQRVYGYLPCAGHLLVRPGRVDARGFRDTSDHRAALPSPYNAYALTTADAAYEADREDLQVLFRPLFFTSFLLADQVAEQVREGGTEVVALSSASSKTAYGAAFALRDALVGGPRVELVGLTSAANVAFTEGLGVYDRVLAYDDVPALAPQQPTVYLDLAGSAPLRSALHAHLGAGLRADVVIGVTHQDSSSAGTLDGVRPTVFFAPERMRARSQQWGREELDERFAAAWQLFAPVVQGWVDVVVGHGPQALQEVWLRVLNGQSPPREGNVLAL